MVETQHFKFLNPRFLVPFLLKELLILIVGSVVICFYLVIIGLSTPIYLYRFLLSKFTKYFKPNLGKMVTARGQFFAIEKLASLNHPPRSNIVAAVAVEGDLTIDQIRLKLKCNLLDKKDDKGELKYPEATQYVTSYMGFKYWKPDPFFDLNNHVKPYKPETQSGSSGTPLFSKGDLRDLLELLLNQSFHPGRSPWEIFLVNNYINPELSSGKMTLLVFKTHHSMADGFGVMNTFMSSVSELPPKVPEPKYMERGYLRLLMFYLTYPFRVLREISQFIVMSLENTPWKIRDSEKGWKQLYQNSPLISMEQVKEIKNRFGVSFASVMHSCLGAAIEKCLVSKYGVEEARRYKKMPCFIALPLPGHPLKFRNFCTAAMIYLPTKSMDSVKRLRQCEEDLFIAKKSTMPMIGKFLPIVGGSMFAGMAAMVGKNRSFPVALSNFPLSELPFEIDGKTVINMEATAGTSAGCCGLGILVHSYMDGVQVALTGEKGIFSREDLNLMVAAVVDELGQLYNLSLV